MSKLLTATALALMLIAATMVTANGAGFEQAAPGCIDDPEDRDEPRGEVLRFCAAIDTGRAAFAIDVVQVTDPNSDPNWTGSDNYFNVDVETTGDTEPDFQVQYRNRDGFGVSARVLDLNTFRETCVGSATFEVSRYVARDLTVGSCFGGVTDFRAIATLRYGQTDPFFLEIDETGAVTPATGALPVPLDGGAPAPAPPPPPPPPGAPAEALRLEGPSRYETAIAISKYQFPNGSTDVYLSRQDVFADSISSGSLTGGPILLVPQCGPVPPGVLDEVRRLSPQRVIALGGDLAVCDQVLADVQAATT